MEIGRPLLVLLCIYHWDRSVGKLRLRRKLILPGQRTESRINNESPSVSASSSLLSPFLFSASAFLGLRL